MSGGVTCSSGCLLSSLSDGSFGACAVSRAASLAWMYARRFTSLLLRAGCSLLLSCFLVTLPVSPAYAEGVISEAAATAYGTLVGDAVSAGMANHRLMEDLSLRWFAADANKRDKIPVVPENGLGTPMTDFQTWPEWWSVANSNVFYYPYKLVELDGVGSWTSTSPNADIEYGKWYDWFEGTAPGSGGSGSDGSFAGTLPMTETLYPLVGTYGPDVLPVSSNVTLTYPNESVNATVANLLSNNGFSYYAYIYCNYNFGTYYRGPCNFVMSTEPIQVSYAVRGNYNGRDYYSVTVSSEGTMRAIKYGNSLTNSSNSFTLEPVVNTTTTAFNDLTDYSSNNPYTYNYLDNNFGRIYGVWCSLGSATPDAPTGPVYPTPPSDPLPTPPTDGTVPTVNVPLTTQPTYEGNGTGTTTADLAPILEVLRSINTNLVTGFEHFEGVFNDQMAALQDYLQTWNEWWKAFFTGWRDTWQEWERDFMYECNKVNKWLKGIFYKLGAGGASEPDPIVDDEGWEDWYQALWRWLTEKLTPDAEEVQQLSGMLDDLKRRFPFSIPWDIATMLGLLAAPPVTPVITLDVPYGFDGSGMLTTRVVIDLTPWDDVAAMGRRLELFAFTFYLAFASHSLLVNLNNGLPDV